MTANIDGNKITFEGDDEVYEFNTKNCNVETYVDDKGQQQVYFPVIPKPFIPRKIRKRATAYIKKTADKSVTDHIKEDFENMKYMSRKQLAGLNARYIEIRDNIKRWDLKHPKNRFCYYKLSQEPEQSVKDEEYDTIKEAIHEKQIYYKDLIARLLKKLEPIYWKKDKEEMEQKMKTVEERQKVYGQVIECPCGAKIKGSLSYQTHLKSKKHMRWDENYTTMYNENPKLPDYNMPSCKLIPVEISDDDEVIDEVVGEVIGKIDEEDFVEMEEEDFDDMMKAIDNVKEAVQYVEEEEEVMSEGYNCLCGITLKPPFDLNKHFKSDEHLQNISESENDDEEEALTPTENIIISISEPIACC